MLLMQYGTPSGIVQHSAPTLTYEHITDSRGAPECLLCPILSSVVRANFGKEAFSSFLSRVCAFFTQLAVNCFGPLGYPGRERWGPQWMRTCSRKNAAQWISSTTGMQQLRKRIFPGKVLMLRGKAQGRYLGWANDRPLLNSLVRPGR